MDKYGIIIAAFVAIVAMVGMVLYFSDGMSGAVVKIFPRESEYRCVLDYTSDKLVCETMPFGEQDPAYTDQV